MLGFLDQLASSALDALNQGNAGALLALFFISALTEVGIPFPFILDSILIVTGYRTGLISFEIFYIMVSLLLGREFGGSVIYWLTRTVGSAFINWLSRRFPKIKDRLNWLTAKLSVHAPLAVAIARLTPGLLTPSSVASGAISLRYTYFLLGIALSSVIADAALLILGFATASGLKYLGFRPSIWLVVVCLVILISIGWATRQFFVKRSRRNDPG
jgi:membrane protein DedA with SNARE-associated domain